MPEKRGREHGSDDTFDAVSSLTRRELIRLFGAAAALAQLPGCHSDSGDSVFTADELGMLRGFADVVIPEDDLPGGSKLGAVEYIEALLLAFDTAIPKIFAGGPFSDRNPLPGAPKPPNDFATFVELDRVATAAWHTALPDIKMQLQTGLAAARSSASGDLTHADYVRIFDAQSDEFRALVIDLVTEAAFAAPEYGGNLQLAGWNMIHFEGDTQPLGYTQWNGTSHVERPEAPFSTANGPDPEPLTDDVRQLLVLVIQVLGGRSTP
jgi:gluconate 2-dehydrogenase gamma chain